MEPMGNPVVRRLETAEAEPETFITQTALNTEPKQPPGDSSPILHIQRPKSSPRIIAKSATSKSWAPQAADHTQKPKSST